MSKLNYACLHDPIPTPFTNEVLENVAGKEKKLIPLQMGFQDIIRLG
jgi:hypothetical protein